MTLAQARKAADEIRITKLARGVDPLAEREAEAAEREAAKARAEADAIRAAPFREWASRYIREKGSWRSAKHRAQWQSTLASYVFPFIGDMPADDVTGAHIVEILMPIWLTKPATARRVRGRIEAILDHAAGVDEEYRNPAALTKRLLKALPRAAEDVDERHFPALSYHEIAPFMTALRARDGMAARALEFLILTAARTGEVLGAQWGEIDQARKVWTVPKERMKRLREHRVPLSPAALAVLASVKEARRGEFVFPSLPHDKPLSNMALLTVLKRMGRADITVHGMRSTFRTWAAERSVFAREVCEAALAHKNKNAVEAAYLKSDFLEKRRPLMDQWAAFCEAGGGEVVLCAHKRG